MLCAKCGKQLKTEGYFCPSCAASQRSGLSPQPEAASPQNNNPSLQPGPAPAKPKSGNGCLITVLLVIGIQFFAGFVAPHFGTIVNGIVSAFNNIKQEFSAPYEAPAVAAEDLQISGARLVKEDGTTYITGTVQNFSPRRYTSFRITYALYYNNQYLGFAAYQDTQGLEPDEERYFKIAASVPNAQSIQLTKITGKAE